MWLDVAVFVASLAIYYYLSSKFKYWKRRMVEFRPPNILFGNMFRVITLKESVGQLHTSLYRQFEGVPYVGYYIMSRPGLLIRDAEIVRNVMVQYFHYFAENDLEVDAEIDPLFARNPFVLHGDEWKRTRNLLTPAFSSGKMKLMFPLMEAVTENMTKYISRKMGSAMEAKDLSGRFTVDNVATCAFGLDARSFTDKDGQFRETGIKMFNIDTVSGIKLMLGFLYPTLVKVLKIRLVPLECANYFSSIVSQTLMYRTEHNLNRNDFLDMMAQLKIKHGENFSDIDVTAHALGFFLDGYETSATTLSFALYCISKHREVQTKLRGHIETVLAQYNGDMCYEAVQEMNYLEMVILESMRQYPPLYALGKKCTKTYPISPSLTVESGTPIVIPVHALQNDERYFPNPDRYDPERFSDENKQNIEKGSFLPFGDGPRACLGQLFGLLQVKIAIVSIIRLFELSVNKRTIQPIRIDPTSFLTGAVGGLWLDLQKL